MKVKHSKYKNTGLLFELLVRQITADTLNGVATSPALSILKTSFVKTELGKEHKLYETLFSTKNLTEQKAEVILNTVLESTAKLNRSALRREKYNLINEIKKHYNLQEFFGHKVNNYRCYASFYKLVEIHNSDINDANAVISNKMTILETICSTPVSNNRATNEVMDEFAGYDKETRTLAYNIMLEKFNEKYGTLNTDQKNILREYINHSDNAAKLREFYNSNVTALRESLTTCLGTIEDQTTQIKLTEAIKLLQEVDKTHRVSTDDLVNLLQYCELKAELTNL